MKQPYIWQNLAFPFFNAFCWNRLFLPFLSLTPRAEMNSFHSLFKALLRRDFFPAPFFNVFHWNDFFHNRFLQCLTPERTPSARSPHQSKVLGGEGGGLEGEGEPFSRKVPLPPPIFHPSTVRRRAEAGSGRGCPGPRARTRRAWRIDGPR